MNLFDTNIIIGFLKNDINIVSRIRDENELAVAVITMGEMFYGAKNSQNPEKNTQIYTDFFRYCKILEITEETARHYAKIRYELKKIGKPIPDNDIWIAALAKENDLKIITRDKHLKNISFISTEEW